MPSKKLEVKLVKSLIGAVEKQIATAHALGLRKIGATNVVPENPAILGQIRIVEHLVEVKEVK